MTSALFDVYRTRSGQIMDCIPRKPGLMNRVETTLEGKFTTKQRFLRKQEAGPSSWCNKHHSIRHFNALDKWLSSEP